MSESTLFRTRSPHAEMTCIDTMAAFDNYYLPDELYLEDDLDCRYDSHTDSRHSSILHSAYPSPSMQQCSMRSSFDGTGRPLFDEPQYHWTDNLQGSALPQPHWSSPIFQQGHAFADCSLPPLSSFSNLPDQTTVPPEVVNDFLSPNGVVTQKPRANRSTSFVSNASSSRSYSVFNGSRSTSPSASEMEKWGYLNDKGSWSCAYPGCTSKSDFHRGCDLRKHYRRHTKSLFCRHADCPQSAEGGFSSKKDRARHEAKHNPQIRCEWDGCERMFSRVDNMVSCPCNPFAQSSC